MAEEVPNAGIGHNVPPADADVIADRLSEKYKPQVIRKNELIDALERAPEEIADDDVAGSMALFIKQFHEATKEAKEIHKAEKAPYLENGRRVDTWFKAIWEPLETAKAKVEERLAAYQKEKADRERLVREAEEKKARAEAEKAEQKALETKEALKTDGGLTAAIEAEDAKQEAVKKAVKAEAAAAKPEADMGAIHTESGVSAKHKMKWVGEIVDLQNLDLITLRPYLKFTELERAVNEYAKKTNGSPLEGAEMSEKITVRVR